METLTKVSPSNIKHPWTFFLKADMKIRKLCIGVQEISLSHFEDAKLTEKCEKSSLLN